MKVFKLASGRLIKSYSVKLPNGNLSVPTGDGPREVPPGDPLFKRWLPWAVAPDDPRIEQPAEELFRLQKAAKKARSK